MGGIDAKLAQTEVSFVGHVGISLSNDQEQQKERELVELIQELQNAKVQLEAKDCLYKQALVEVDHHQKTADDLSALLRDCDLQKQFYVDECLEANVRMNEMETAMEEMLSESKKVQEQLSSSQSRLLNVEAEFASVSKARAEAMLQAEAMENALRQEKHKMECTAKQLETIHDLEDQLLNKSALIGSLQLELTRVNELHVSSQKSASDSISELNRLQEVLNLQENENLDQANRIELLEAELKQLKFELGNANAEANRLSEYSENMNSKLEKEQVETALLKFELHKAKSRLAAAEERIRNNSNEKSVKQGANVNELENTKKELELAVSKMGPLKIRAQQATSRAEAAEKAKIALEEEVRRLKRAE